MLYLKKVHLENLVKHARQESPNEACGILAGRNNQVERVFPMQNTEQSSESYFMDPQEQLKVTKEIRNAGLEMLAIYHSHPHSPARPSAKDIELAFYPEASYIIISLEDKDKPIIKSFKIVDGKITEEEIRIE